MNREKLISSLQRTLNVFMFVFLGVYLGTCLATYLDYRQRPDLYAMWSAPWYTRLLPLGVGFAGVFTLCLLCKWALRRWAGGKKNG